jgi:triphosphoribosyl-dephospho-CoA synthase
MTRNAVPAAAPPAAAAVIAAAAQLACVLEATAPKPGNVSPGRHFADLRYEDFLMSAIAIGEPFAGVGTRGLGATIHRAVDTSVRWVGTNANLGIVLLLAPIAKAAVGDATGAMPDGSTSDADRAAARRRSLRIAVQKVLDDTTVEDARAVYAAIRRASPGGLGRAEAQDVSGDPTMPLLDVMRLAASRDDIAREYATGFDVTFDTAAPALDRARRDGLSWDEAVVETFLTVLAARADTHIVRRSGPALAAAVSERARSVLAAGGVRSEAGRRALEAMDQSMRDAHNTANPGTAADLTAAALFVVLLSAGWTRVGGRDAATR